MRESLKSMLAMGWNIERSKEGEAMFQQREGDKQKKTSDPQARSSERIVLFLLLIPQYLPLILKCMVFN